MKLNRFPIYFVLAPAIICATLLILFSIVFLEELIYPIFRRVAYMGVPEKEYYIPVEEEPALVDIKPGKDLSMKDRAEARAQIEDEYKQLYGSEYKKRLRDDVKAARKQIGDEVYDKVWGPVLKKYEEQ